LHQKKNETLNSLASKIETHDVAKCLGDNYSDQIGGPIAGTTP